MLAHRVFQLRTLPALISWQRLFPPFRQGRARNAGFRPFKKCARAGNVHLPGHAAQGMQRLRPKDGSTGRGAA